MYCPVPLYSVDKHGVQNVYTQLLIEGIECPPFMVLSLDECRPRAGDRQQLNKLHEYIRTAKLDEELENYINQRFPLLLSLGKNGADEMMAIAHQQTEMTQFNKTLKKVLTPVTCII